MKKKISKHVLSDFKKKKKIFFKKLKKNFNFLKI